LWSRNDKQQTEQFPEVAMALRQSLDKPCIVDGEIACLDKHGRSSFRALQQRFHLLNPRDVQARMASFPAHLYLFDVLFAKDEMITSLPLVERKHILQHLVEWSDQVRWTPHQKAKGIVAWRKACRRGEEGVIGKDIHSHYEQRRSSAWVKIKCLGKQEFVIGGFTDPQRSRVGFGALLIGYYDDGKLRFAGKVGTGFSNQTLLALQRRLEQREVSQSPLVDTTGSRSGTAHWVKPELVAEIAFAEWTQHGLLRQPRFEGLRVDKKPKECRREVANGRKA
jgi:DNA ligase D-like protein (predicted ligase)